jgi:hypothetical protein
MTRQSNAADDVWEGDVHWDRADSEFDMYFCRIDIACGESEGCARSIYIEDVTCRECLALELEEQS